jgi:hypothetical protein
LIQELSAGPGLCAALQPSRAARETLAVVVLAGHVATVPIEDDERGGAPPPEGVKVAYALSLQLIGPIFFCARRRSSGGASGSTGGGACCDERSTGAPPRVASAARSGGPSGRRCPPDSRVPVRRATRDDDRDAHRGRPGLGDDSAPRDFTGLARRRTCACR